MMRGMTSTGYFPGNYIPGDTRIHRLDAFGKLIVFDVFLILTLMTHDWIGYGILFMVCLFLIQRTGIGFRRGMASIIYLWRFFLLIFFMNAFFYQSDPVIFHWWIFSLSVDGMLQGANVIVRVVLVMLNSNVLTATTPPMKLMKAMEKILSPLKLLHMPAREIAMILSVAMQFIPILYEESQMIRKAQIARGAKLESRHWWQRGKSLIPLVVPIFVTAFRRAHELSVAMEARGYQRRGKKRVR